MNYLIDFMFYTSLFGGLFLSAVCIYFLGGLELPDATIAFGGIIFFLLFAIIIFTFQICAARFLYRIYSHLEKCDFG